MHIPNKKPDGEAQEIKFTLRANPNLWKEITAICFQLTQQGDKTSLNTFVIKALKFYVQSVKNMQKGRCPACGEHIKKAKEKTA